MKTIVAGVSTVAFLALGAPVFAQAQGQAQVRESRDSRYQIGMMEGVLEKAVEHGAAVMRERLQQVLPADMLLSQPVRVRGIRLDGYGVIFDIDVPSLQTAPLWSLQTLDQNNLGLESAINAMRAHVDASGDPTLQQALQRMELAMPLPVVLSGQQGSNLAAPAPRLASGSALSTDDAASRRQPAPAPNPRGPVFTAAQATDAYHTEISDALQEAMLDYSRGLAIGANEWLTVAAGGVDNQPLTGVSDDMYTVVISIKGSDLADFLGNRITHDEARQRIQVKVF
jgi:hypothetical protein